ncbi:hypothetical protein RU86_GL000554 [Lactococcus piscium]|uniref:Uncharacterized protein n=1 Tax=Pseudolactococcus piscium TaxID=1364 RepID=A0A2A5RX48_9LACT|nr:YfbU family protein [Lactococcus piscium]PCS05799.1 hypothetical protein RU86_GL000554 [Lactococcus piscium]
MELSLFERQVLANQYDLLEKLSDDENDKEYYSQRKEIYELGFEGEYFEHVPYTDSLSKEDCKFVYRIINLYDDLYYEWNQNDEIKNGIDSYQITFSGFDANDDIGYKLYSYAKFLIKDQGKFHDTRKLFKSGEITLNSHGMGPGIDGYHEMIERKEDLFKKKIDGHKNEWSLEDIKYILGR